MEFWKDDKIASIPSEEGLIPFNIPSIDKQCFTYYRTFGDLAGGATPPVIVLHGTSGGSDGYLNFAQLWLSHRIPLVFYDQIGCCNSTRLPETRGNHEFWQPSLFIAELNNLLSHLRIQQYHILGHSWGGMWGGVFASGQPQGLQKLVLSSPCASKALYHKGIELNFQGLPLDAQEAYHQAIQAQDPRSDGFAAANALFFQKFLIGSGVCIYPPIAAAFQKMQEDPTAAESLFGIMPMAGGGSTKDFDSIPLLHRINVPTLVYNSEDDICHDVGVAPYIEHIPRVRRVKFDNASHFVHLQSSTLREKVMMLVGDFLVA